MKTRITVIALAVGAMLSACSPSVRSLSKAHQTEAYGAIPAEFGGETSTVLFVLSGDRRFDRHLQRQVRRRYLGPHTFVTAADLERPPFSNVNQFRYVFSMVQKREIRQAYRPENARHRRPIIEPTAVTTYRFFVEDRQHQRVYESPISSPSREVMLQGYLHNLEAKREAGTWNRLFVQHVHFLQPFETGHRTNHITKRLQLVRYQVMKYHQLHYVDVH